MIRWIAIAAFAALLAHGSAWAQQASVLSSCGTASYAGGVQDVTQDTAGRGCVAAPLTGTGTNPTSALTRPSNTTAYAGTSATPQLIASSTTAGSIVVPSFAIQTAAGAASISRVRLSSNVTTGWAGVNLLINLWSAAPTYTNGDGGTWAPATGAASWLGTYSCTMLQFGDGATCQAVLLYGSAPVFKLASGTAVFWDVEIASSATPISGQTFTVVPEIFN